MQIQLLQFRVMDIQVQLHHNKVKHTDIVSVVAGCRARELQLAYGILMLVLDVVDSSILGMTYYIDFKL